MAQLQVPESPKEFATHYQMLLGVDYQADQTQVDRKRSPDMVNMISDFGGNPVKRDGYRKVGTGYASLLMVEGDMYGVYAVSSVFKIAKLVLNGYELEEVAGESYTRLWNIGDVNGAFAYQRKIYVLADKCLISFDVETHDFAITGVGTGMMSHGDYDGETAVGEYKPTNPDIVPNTIIDLKPDGTGGSTLDDKNLMSIYQVFSYKGDDTSTAYKIPNYTKMGTWIKAEVKNSSGDWVATTAYHLGTVGTEYGKTLDGSGFAQSNIVDTTITFDVAPPSPTTLGITGADTVRITFAPFSMDEVETGKYRGYYNEIFAELLKSNASTFQANRMFVADKYKVYYSEVANPFMVSDLSWFDVDSEVIGFTRTSNYLVVLTKDNGRTTIYLASEATRTVDSQTGETETYFAVKESNAGIGAIAPKCISTLSDEPMFLSSTGLYGILSNYLSEKYAVNRSSRINRKLCKEQNLENAVGMAFNDYFYLAINGRMYVLDGRHKESDRAGNKPLEAYYFEGLPAIENMYVIDNKMYFTAEGNTYTWNDDLAETERYYDDAYLKAATAVEWQISDKKNEPPTGEWVDVKPTPQAGEYLWYKATYDDLSEEITLEEVEVGDTKLTGIPVRARWCSTFDDDGSPQKLKTLMKKGSMITLVPHYKSGCEITLVKDGDAFEYLGSFDSSLQTFEFIDFLRFTFNANAVAIDSFTKKKIKKYKRLQIQVENNNPEPFGITQITKTYTFGNYAKR